MSKTGVSLSDLNAEASSESPFEFEYIAPDGSGSEVFLQVLGDESKVVKTAIAKLLNERRRKEILATAQAKSSGRENEVFMSVEDDVEFGHRLAAARLVGWRGITEEFSPELALQLVRSNSHLTKQVLGHAGAFANFTKRSPKA